MLAATLFAVASLLPAVFGLPSPNLHSRANGFNYGGETVRGVNLGGWLVLEPWITPSLFEATGNDAIVDEYTYGQMQDYNRAKNALTNHWNSWITEDDFRQIAAAGLNHVRIPIGFWAYDISGGEPYIQGQAPYLDKAIQWASNNGLKVMIDLHGAPGSQNGFDNSGRRGGADWANNYNNVQRTRDVIYQLTKKYSQAQYVNTVTSIGLLNEPAGFYGDPLMSTTRQFWQDAYHDARSASGGQNSQLIVIHDAFQPLSSWTNFMSPPDYQQVAIDHHHYQVFSPSEVSQSWDQHLQQICNVKNNYQDSTLWLLTGEWSLATTDCAKWLNGRGRGSRYQGEYDGGWWIGSCNDKTGSGDNFSSEYKEFLRKFYDIQSQVFESYGQGWFFWTWKNEQAAEWSYQTGVNKGWIPRNPGDHRYSLNSICG